MLVEEMAKVKRSHQPTSPFRSLFRFCSEVEVEAVPFPKHAGAEHFKTFLQWTLYSYLNVRPKGGLDKYWRALKMYTYDRCGRELSDVLTKDVTNVKANDL